MEIISYNLNGIRAAIKKGLFDWLAGNNFDIICFQEVKASLNDVDLAEIEKLGYKVHWFSAQKKGYSGVAVFTKLNFEEVFYGTGHVESDEEGRVLILKNKDISIINTYFPSGTSGEIRQEFKYDWLDKFGAFIKKYKVENPNIILCGDVNIAHTDIDIHDPKGNKNSSGFLIPERNWLSSFLNSGWVDCYRKLYPNALGAYTWWSVRNPQVRLSNKGWRIDYFLMTESLLPKLEDAKILGDIKHSDHCPIYLNLK